MSYDKQMKVWSRFVLDVIMPDDISECLREKDIISKKSDEYNYSCIAEVLISKRYNYLKNVKFEYEEFLNRNKLLLGYIKDNCKNIDDYNQIVICADMEQFMVCFVNECEYKGEDELQKEAEKYLKDFRKENNVIIQKTENKAENEVGNNNEYRTLIDKISSSETLGKCKEDIRAFFNKHNIQLTNFNPASERNNCYWITPYKKVLESEWQLILWNQKTRIMNVFIIPAGTFSEKNFARYEKNSSEQFDVKLKYENERWFDTAKKKDFTPYWRYIVNFNTETIMPLVS